jgi:hypothetical protein
LLAFERKNKIMDPGVKLEAQKYAHFVGFGS